MSITDNELITRVKEDLCSESFEELLSRHSNLYYKVCQKYLPTLKQLGVPSEDVFNDVQFVFFKSLNSFNPNKNTKFSTWLGNYARYNCLNYINEYKKHNFYEESDLEANLDYEITSPPDHESDATINHIYSILKNLKDKRIVKVYSLRYEKNGDKKATWSEIAKKMDISTQTAINLHTRGRNFLKNKLKA
jgi:RNA polymerase sigma factor (sigma-70 family)